MYDSNSDNYLTLPRYFLLVLILRQLPDITEVLRLYAETILSIDFRKLKLAVASEQST
jgi:hypothetical protein